MTEDSLFWADLARDLEDPEFLQIFNEEFTNVKYIGYESDCTCEPEEGCDEEGDPGCAYCRALDCEWSCPAEVDNLSYCDYYQGVGSFGCQEEPACMTSCPSGGWPEITWTPREANTLAIRRYAYRMQNWLGWQKLKRWTQRTV